MTPRPISKVALDAKLGLLVTPQAESYGTYEYIYRAGNGLRWNREHHAFYASEPTRWEHGELLQHVASTVASELGEQLHFTPLTTWEGVSSELEDNLREALSHDGSHERLA